MKPLKGIVLSLTALLISSCAVQPRQTIRIMHFGDALSQKNFEAVLAPWKKAHPGVKVSLEPVSFASYNDKILTEIAGGTSADVAWVENGQAATLIPKGALLPLNEFIAKDTSLDIKTYWPAIVARFTVDAKLYCLPNDVAPVACIYYNKRLFDKAGIPYPSDNWDWNDFLAIAKKLTEKDDSGRTVQYGFFSYFMDSWIYSAGGQYVDNIQKPRRCVLNSAQAMSGLQFFFDLALKYGVMPSPIGDNAMSDMSAEQAFIIQKVAMLNSGIWSAGIINKSVGETFDWDIAMFPRAPGKPHAVVGTGGSGWGVLKYSKHPELAWELVKLMSGEQMQRTICSLPNSSQQPSIIALSKSPDVWLKFPPKPRNKAILNTAMDYVVFSPFDPRWWEVWRKFATPELEKVWLKQKTLKEAVEIIETEANKAFSEPL